MVSSSLDRYRSDDVPVSGIGRTIDDDGAIMAESAAKVQYERSNSLPTNPHRPAPHPSGIASWARCGRCTERAGRGRRCESGSGLEPQRSDAGRGRLARPARPATPPGTPPGSSADGELEPERRQLGREPGVAGGSEPRARAPPLGVDWVSGRTTTNRPGPSSATRSRARVRSRSSPPITGPSRATAAAAASGRARHARRARRSAGSPAGSAAGRGGLRRRRLAGSRAPRRAMRDRGPRARPGPPVAGGGPDGDVAGRSSGRWRAAVRPARPAGRRPVRRDPGRRRAPAGPGRSPGAPDRPRAADPGGEDTLRAGRGTPRSRRPADRRRSRAEGSRWPRPAIAAGRATAPATPSGPRLAVPPGAAVAERQDEERDRRDASTATTMTSTTEEHRAVHRRINGRSGCESASGASRRPRAGLDRAARGGHVEDLGRDRPEVVGDRAVVRAQGDRQAQGGRLGQPDAVADRRRGGRDRRRSSGASRGPRASGRSGSPVRPGSAAARGRG